jgi:sugar lactone lactonase YvrE
MHLFQIAVAGGKVYGAGQDGAVYRLDGESWTRLTGPIDASSVAVDAAGNLYVTVYEPGIVRRVTPDGAVSTFASGFFHPHSLAIAGGSLYVADTENRALQRVDLATGAVTRFGGDVGITVALAAGPDGSIWSADVVRDGTGGGITRTTAAGVTTRVLVDRAANGVAVASDGTVYVNDWETKRVSRLVAGRPAPIARG